jgi:hypothetical protein
MYDPCKHSETLKLACEFIEDFTGTCPYDMYNVQFDCETSCNNKTALCWEKYFKSLLVGGKEDANL